jgi:hypothetical protein
MGTRLAPGQRIERCSPASKADSLPELPGKMAAGERIELSTTRVRAERGNHPQTRHFGAGCQNQTGVGGIQIRSPVTERNRPGAMHEYRSRQRPSHSRPGSPAPSHRHRKTWRWVAESNRVIGICSPAPEAVWITHRIFNVAAHVALQGFVRGNPPKFPAPRRIHADLAPAEGVEPSQTGFGDPLACRSSPVNGSRGVDRTRDQVVNSHLLYR